MQSSSRAQWYLVFMLTMAYALSFVDRQILSIMIGSIKRDLGGLSDTEVSLILGLAFSLVYTLSGIPAARIADRSSRRNLLVAGIAGWSAMTSLACLANTYWHLFIARMGVGVGEAVLQPAATSILADTFDKRRLPVAYGVLGMAPFVGIGLSSIFGGPLVDYLEARPQVHVPVLGALFSWQVALVVVGLPGVLLAALMFTVKEPRRKGEATELVDHYSIKEVMAFISSRGRYLSMHFIGYLCMAVHGYAYLTWVFELFIRKHDWSRTDIGLGFGTISIVTGISGSIWGGYFVGRMLSRGTSDAAMRLALYLVLVMGVLSTIMPLLSNGIVALCLCIPISFCMAAATPLNLVALQSITPNRMRGQLVAAYEVSVGFLSYLLAPLGVGLMNDYLFKSENAIDLSLATSSAINYPICAVCLFLSLKPLRAALEKAREWNDRVE